MGCQPVNHHCSYCGSRMHPGSHCPKTWGGQIERAKLRCSYCGSTKHNTAGCPKTLGGSAPLVLLD